MINKEQGQAPTSQAVERTVLEYKLKRRYNT